MMAQENIVNNKSRRLYGIDVLRCVAFLMIFISHCGVRLPLGECGVSIFLVISGFVTMYSCSKKGTVFKVGLKNNFKYAISKIKDLYLLHIVCTLLMTLKLFIGNSGLSSGFIVLKFVLNILLIQEWFPISASSINGVSWYLCVLFLFYFVYPWINNYFSDSCNFKKAERNIFLLLIAIMLICVVSRLLLGNFSLENDKLFRSNLCHWIVYYFPPVRLLEMLVGCNLAYIFIFKSHIRDARIYSILEVIAVLLLVLSNCLYINYFVISELGLLAMNETWWKDSLLYIIPSMLAVYLFAVGKGVISNFLNNKVVMYIADLSRNGFLIHFVVIQYLDSIIEMTDGITFLFNYDLIRIVVYAIITIISCEIWKRFMAFIRNRKVA